MRRYLWEHHTIRRFFAKRKSGLSGPSASWEMGFAGSLPDCSLKSCSPSADFQETPNCTAQGVPRCKSPQKVPSARGSRKKSNGPFACVTVGCVRVGGGREDSATQPPFARAQAAFGHRNPQPRQRGRDGAGQTWGLQIDFGPPGPRRHVF